MDEDVQAAARDPGIHQGRHPLFTEQEVQGHRAHTVYVGVHLPGVKRKSHHRRHRPNQQQPMPGGGGHFQKPAGGQASSPPTATDNRQSSTAPDDDDENKDDDCMSSIPEEDGTGVSWRRGSMNSAIAPGLPPSQRVQFILGEEIADGAIEPRPVFSELGELVSDGLTVEWQETARWIKFEEDVEEGGHRWSKPHVAALSLHSLLELRSLLLRAVLLFDLEATTLEQVADLAIEALIKAGQLPEAELDKMEVVGQVRQALLRRHRHLHERHPLNARHLPLIRSIAEIGRSHSSCKRIKRTPSGHSLKNGNLDAEGHHKGNTHLMRKIPAGAEASNILVGEVDFLEKCLCVLIRLKEAVPLGDLAEVPVPTRFIFLLLGPSGESGQVANGVVTEAGSASEEKPSVVSLEGPNQSNGHGKSAKCTIKPGAPFHEVGRAMATIMTDEVFTEIAYRAKNRHHILTAVDEFLDSVTVLPPGEWDPSIRIEPPPAVPSQEQRKRLEKKSSCSNEDDEIEEAKRRQDSGLTRSGKCFGGVINDIKRKVPWYWSDFRDACSLQCIASWIFLYFACLSPIITFGGLLGQATNQSMAAMESLISGFVCGIGYGLFSGQPLTILGSTGPVLVFESIMFELCQWFEWDYLTFRLWVGLWIGVILFVLVAVDASALVCYITRFTEENFATLIAFIFICKALENVMHISDTYPIHGRGVAAPVNGCLCLPPPTAPGALPVLVDPNTTVIEWTTLNLQDCLSEKGVWSASLPTGASCTPSVPDVFLMSLLLFFGTFTISVILKDFKNSLFFPGSVRRFISDFAVIIAIFSMTLLDVYMGIETPKLEVPTEFKPTRPDRGWIIIPSSKTPLWTIPLAIIPALLGTILIFMDQQITSVIVNRSENKLKKGCGYHLDLLILAILIVVCTIMGLPWFVAATVLSINHVNSLKQESECAAPGEKPRFLGVREQRVTHVAIFVTIGLSVGLTPVLKRIPMPVLFGVFLYMGVASLKGLQLFHRLLLVFMPVKYQPDYIYLRQVPLWRVHLFTGIQLACLIILWAVKSFSITSVFFPLMLIVMIGVRKSLDCLFTQRELKILDDVMPERIQRTDEDSANTNENTDEEKGLEMHKSGGNLQIPLTNGNVIKIPLSSINITEEMNKTSIWRQLDSGSTQTQQQQQPQTTLIQTTQGSISTKMRRSSKEEEVKGRQTDAECAPGGGGGGGGEVTAL